MKIFLIFALLMVSVDQLNAIEIECDRKKEENYLIGPVQVCFLDTVAIDSPDSTILPRDENIAGVNFSYDKKIRFLPVKISETFPKLIKYFAFGCSLTEVYKIHFENLNKLKSLVLGSNQIEKISSNTFDDLTSLEHLNLSKNY